MLFLEISVLGEVSGSVAQKLLYRSSFSCMFSGYIVIDSLMEQLGVAIQDSCQCNRQTWVQILQIYCPHTITIRCGANPQTSWSMSVDKLL
jgi:hypothetical protein